MTPSSFPKTALMPELQWDVPLSLTRGRGDRHQCFSIERPLEENPWQSSAGGFSAQGWTARYVLTLYTINLLDQYKHGLAVACRLRRESAPSIVYYDPTVLHDGSVL